MEKPDSEILDRIISVIEDRREMESGIKELGEKANSLVSEISTKQNKLEIAAYLYWHFPEIRSRELVQAAIGKDNIHKFLDSINSLTANIACDRCGTLIEIKSRSQLKEERKRANSKYSLCEICQTKVIALNQERFRENQRVRNDRLNQLRKMPYREYLQTPEWKERRLRHLTSAGYCCQVCNSRKQPLDVHHRTYERRGQEYYKDLIVLCRDCHRTFHEAGKLAD